MDWTGKVLALAATLAIASLSMSAGDASVDARSERGQPARGNSGRFRLLRFLLVIALVFPSDRPSGEDVAFQLTMPGLEEEPFYRGILLFALDEGIQRAVRFVGVDWGWGAVLSC